MAGYRMLDVENNKSLHVFAEQLQGTNVNRISGHMYELLGYLRSDDQPGSAVILSENLNARKLELACKTAEDGSCLFHALVSQLNRSNSDQPHRLYTELRSDMVDFMRNNPLLKFNDGIRDIKVDLKRFCEGTWEEYLENMSKQATYGDHLVLQSAAVMLGHNILVVTSSQDGGVENNLILVCGGSQADEKETLLLGHRYENHYESLKVKEPKQKQYKYDFMLIYNTDHDIDAAEELHKHLLALGYKGELYDEYCIPGDYMLDTWDTLLDNSAVFFCVMSPHMSNEMKTYANSTSKLVTHAAIFRCMADKTCANRMVLYFPDSYHASAVTSAVPSIFGALRKLVRSRRNFDRQLSSVFEPPKRGQVKQTKKSSFNKSFVFEDEETREKIVHPSDGLKTPTSHHKLDQFSTQTLDDSQSIDSLIEAEVIEFDGNTGQGRCNVCAVKLISKKMKEEHLAGKKHKRRSKMASATKDGSDTHCSTCKVSFTSKKCADQHYGSVRHKERTGCKMEERDRERDTPDGEDCSEVPVTEKVSTAEPTPEGSWIDSCILS